MGSTLEAQKKIVGTVSPGKPYYSSKPLGESYEQNLITEGISGGLRTNSPFGKASPRAAALDVGAAAINLLRNKAGQRGARHAKKVMESTKYRNKKTRVF
jgi:hypothetical protein